MPRRTLVSGGLAALFVVMIGNLGQIEVVLERLDAAIPRDWWYWNASRAISVPVEEPGPVTEFPAFTYLYADLHPHAMAFPYTAAALGLALAFLRQPRALSRGASVLRFALAALVIGALYPTNTWDFPTYAFLLGAGLFLGCWIGGNVGARSLLRAAGLAVAVVAVAYVAFLPFHQHAQSVFSGFQRWTGSQTSLVDYLTVHGFFLFVIVSALLVDFWLSRDAGPVARVLRIAIRRRRIERLLRLHDALVPGVPWHILGAGAAAVGWLAAVLLAVVGEPVAGLVVAVCVLASVLFFRASGSTAAGTPLTRGLHQMGLVLVLTALLITLAVEYVVVRNIDVGRSATVFKFYNQVWVLLGVAAAVSTSFVYHHLRRLPRAWRIRWQVAFSLLFAGTLLYPMLAIPAKVDDRFDPTVGETLNGMAFMTKAVHFDRKPFPLAPDLGAMRWILANVEGSPVFAEINTAPTLYGWGNRFAMFTGNPVVVGWDFHERQQRAIGTGEEAVQSRVADIQRAYRTLDPEVAYEILRRYDVQYVVVGPLERAYFPRGQRKWETRVGSLWDVAYRNPGAAIYRLRDVSNDVETVDASAAAHTLQTTATAGGGAR